MPVADDAIDPILLKVLDIVPYRLSLHDGVEAARRQLRELPRRPVHPELRVADRTIGGPAGDLAVRIYWPEHPYPAAVQDAMAATEWVSAHVGELGPGTPGWCRRPPRRPSAGWRR